jgi:predicted dehydrogenase
VLSVTPPRHQVTPIALGVIGAGSFAQRVLIPAFKAADFELIAVASHAGLSASGAAEQFGFRRAVTAGEILADPELSVVAIATRHATHASIAQRALETGLAVFVEKPPCLTDLELEQLRRARDASDRPFMVGFNRRHAPLVQTMYEQFRDRTGPAEVLIRINAGALPPSHWLNDLLDGGGRLLGEGCHFIDLACCPSRWGV